MEGAAVRYQKVGVLLVGVAVATLAACEPAKPDPNEMPLVQVLEGTPFERFMSAAEEIVVVEPAGEGTSVTVEIRQKLRGLSRFGGFLVKRATRRQLDEALDALERVV